MTDLLNHAFYSVVRPRDCLCRMCMMKYKCGVRGCKVKAKLPIKSRAKKGYTPMCMKHAIEAAKKRGAKKKKA